MLNLKQPAKLCAQEYANDKLNFWLGVCYKKLNADLNGERALRSTISISSLHATLAALQLSVLVRTPAQNNPYQKFRSSANPQPISRTHSHQLLMQIALQSPQQQAG